MKTNLPYSEPWLGPIISILLAFTGLILALAAMILPRSYETHTAVSPYPVTGRDLETVGKDNEAKTMATASLGQSPLPVVLTNSTKCFETRGSILYEGSILQVAQTLTEVVVENISTVPVAVRISWDGKDPWGIGDGEDSYFDDWFTSHEVVRRPFKHHQSVQVWAWGGSGGIVDSCNLPGCDLQIMPASFLCGTPVVTPARLAIYYAWPSVVNGASGNITQATAVFTPFDIVVLGDGLEHPSHEDYTNTVAIIKNLKDHDVKVYSYIDLGVISPAQNLSIVTITTHVDAWATITGVTGIFFDNAGYDFGVSRTRLISAVNYVHNKDLAVFVNAWHPDDVLSGTTPLTKGDWILAESHPVSGGQHIDFDFWFEKSQKLIRYREQLGIQIAAISTGSGSTNYWPIYPPFRCALYAFYLFGFDAFGFTNPNYSASNFGANHLCALPPFPNIGAMYLGAPAGPITSTDTVTYSRSTDIGTIYVFGNVNAPPICDGRLLSCNALFSPLIIKQ
ncbi:MAG: hypothetical protein JW953_13220 [Anaerolineae bacterium]|nr:hypothetical protein [Anaerolineae bacterium]